MGVGKGEGMGDDEGKGGEVRTGMGVRVWLDVNGSVGQGEGGRGCTLPNAMANDWKVGKKMERLLGKGGKEM